ncbi:MAG: cytochrome c biogenesis protein CcdA [Patescibacteria group bacterium]
MKRVIIIISIIAVAVVSIAILKQSSLVSELIWNASGQGSWLLPLVLIAAILDSVHPCSFSILLITIAFLFGLQLSRKKIIQIGGAYIAGIFAAYLFIGLGILRVLHIFNTPHFMGKLGAGLLIAFGLLNLLNRFLPNFPIKLKMPTVSHKWMGSLMEKASFPAAFGLGLLVGLCQFPCMGGPYLMVIGLLRDQVTYLSGFGYLFLYNLILIIPLAAVLWITSDKQVVDKMQEWKRTKIQSVRLWAGIAMIIIGILVLFI